MHFLTGHLNLFCSFEISIRFLWNAWVVRKNSNYAEFVLWKLTFYFVYAFLASWNVNCIGFICWSTWVGRKWKYLFEIALKGGWDVTHRKLTDQFNCCEMWSASFLHPNCFLHTPTQTTPTAMQTSQLKIGKEGATESQMEQMSNIKSLANGIHLLPTLNKDFQGNLHVCYLEFFNVSLIM